MDISFMREFLTLSRCLNFSAAARQLYVSQPMLSKHVMAIEKELDAKLLIRDGRSVRLTEAGRLFAERAEQMIQCFDTTRQEIRDLEKRVESVLTVGYLLATTGDYFPRACKAFHAIHPEVRVSVAALEVDEIIAGVREGSLDIGYTVISEGQIKDLETSLFIRDRYGVICLRSHPLAKRSSISLDDLEGQRILVPNPKHMPSVASASKRAFEGCGYEPDFCEEMRDIGAIRPYLLTTGGVAFTLGHIVRYFEDDYVFVPIDGIDIRPYAAACWKPSHESEILLNFVECMREALLSSGKHDEKQASSI